MSEEKTITLEDWIYAVPPLDYDHIDGPPEEQEIGKELAEHIKLIADFCVSHDIPYNMVFAAASRFGGTETRYTASSNLMPLGKVTPEVLFAAIISMNGGRALAENTQMMVQAAGSRMRFLQTLGEIVTPTK